MNSDRLFERTVFMTQAADTLLSRGLEFPRERSHQRKTGIPQLRVLPRPEEHSYESWVIMEMRQRARFEHWQDAMFMILGISGLAAITWAFFAV